MKSDSRKHLLAEIASMYYLEKRSQNEIALEFGYSRSAISRLLTEAELSGVVEHKINFPSIRNVEMEEKLIQRYKLRNAVVVNRGKLSYAQTLHFVGEQGAEVFTKLIDNDQVISISTGTSIFEVVNALKPCQLTNVKIVQILGSTGVKSDPSIDGPELAGSLAKKVHGSYYALNAPMLMDSKISRETILREKSIISTIDLAYKSDIVLAGVGCITEEPHDSSVVRMGYLEPHEFIEIRDQGAVGYTCGWFFNEKGKIIEGQINDRVVAADFRRIREGKAIVLAIAAGEKKSPAIKAALDGNLLDILITDSSAVEPFL
ncbi:MAG: sugar-binding transcriptional regulator [Anaerolineaceae bacterium]